VPTNSFDERIAKSYEAKWPELFEPAMVDPVVELLAELAGTGAALELGIGTGGSPSRCGGGAFPSTGSSCRRPWSRSCGPSRAATTSA
jgi:hypothetical protein